MDKNILEQYLELKEEIRDLQDRIDRDERRLEKIRKEGVVSDTVKGTRSDGTFGPIKITGYPIPEHNQVKNMIKKRVAKLHILEDDLQNAINEVDEFIGKVPKSDLRMIFRFRYLDDMTWAAVALNMNDRFPKRRIKYTEDSCRMRHDRYLENNLKK
jgi:hypothetical protein|nr:MAG TPA: Protein of unknown function (DUF1492) [Caudoviricetes sp.]